MQTNSLRGFRIGSQYRLPILGVAMLICDAVIRIVGGGWVDEYSWSSGSLGSSISLITRGENMKTVELDREYDEQSNTNI